MTLGAPITISEASSPGPLFRARLPIGMATTAPIAQGEETLQVTVSMSWAIKQAGQ